MPPQVKKRLTDTKKCVEKLTVLVLCTYIVRTIHTSAYLAQTWKKTRVSFLLTVDLWATQMKNLQSFLMNTKERHKDLLNLLQCQPCDEALPDLVHYSSTKGTCERCPKMHPHPVLMRSKKFMLFHAYKIVMTCTEHGVLLAEWNGPCQHCENHNCPRSSTFGLVPRRHRGRHRDRSRSLRARIDKFVSYGEITVIPQPHCPTLYFSRIVRLWSLIAVPRQDKKRGAHN